MLRLAVLRGVDVRILIPSRPDHLVVYAASTIYAYQAVCARREVSPLPARLPASEGDPDRRWCRGRGRRQSRQSARSGLNFEMMVMAAHPAFARDVTRMLGADFAGRARQSVRIFCLARAAQVAMPWPAVRPHPLSKSAAAVVHIGGWRSLCTLSTIQTQNEWTMSTWEFDMSRVAATPPTRSTLSTWRSTARLARSRDRSRTHWRPGAVVLREATRRAGVVPNAAYRHFASRQDLLEAVRAAALSGLAAGYGDRTAGAARQCLRHRGARGSLRAVGAGYLRYALAETGLFRTAFSVPDDVEDDPDPAKAGDSGLNPFQLLGAALDHWVDAGLAASGAPPRRRVCRLVRRPRVSHFVDRRPPAQPRAGTGRHHRCAAIGHGGERPDGGLRPKNATWRGPRGIQVKNASEGSTLALHQVPALHRRGQV